MSQGLQTPSAGMPDGGFAHAAVPADAAGAAGRRKRVLVTTPEWQSAIACLQGLGRAGHDVWLLGANPRSAIAQSRFCRGILPSPPETEGDAWIANLLSALRTGAFDLIVPVSDAAVGLMSRARDEVSALTGLALAPPDRLEIGRDKAKTTRFALEHGVPVPETFFPRDMEEARALARSVDYPCVAKLPLGTGSLGVQVTATPAELVAFFEERGAADNWPFVQRFVPGDLYDVTAVCDRGRMVALFAFRMPMKYHLGGTPPYVYSVKDPALLAAARRFLEAIGWHGCVDLDFLLAPDGRYTLLELNPRLSGTTNFALKMGVELPRAYHDVVFGCAQGDYGSAGYAGGVLFRSVVPAEMWWWNAGRRSRTAEVILKTLNPRVRTNLHWGDPPLLRAQLRDARRMLARRTPF
ncbi:MAG: ATP-grasp domain-containing protein [Acetobacteraceae bacterium]|nr:ATP-grasp domain-containing protein [Acetobacteraceae bacterium]